MSAERQFTAEQVDAAIAAISDPERLRHAQDVITHVAPNLQQILVQALDEGGYLTASAAEIDRAASQEDLADRLREVRTMVAEETRLGMLVGAAIGFELARALLDQDVQPTPTGDPSP